MISFLLIKRFFPIFTSFLIFVFSLLAVFLFQYSFTFFLIFFSLSLFFSSFFLLILLGKEIKNFWHYLIIFFLLIFLFIPFFLFVQDQTLKIIFIFFLAIFSFIFFELIFRFLYEPRKYPVYSLENFSFSIFLLISFFLFSLLFAFKTFLNFPIIYSLILLFFVTLFNLYFLFKVRKIHLEKIYFFIVGLILLELFYSFNFLPTSFYVNGLGLTILFFLMVNLIIKNKEGILTTKVIRKYLFLTLFALILVAIFAKWR